MRFDEEKLCFVADDGSKLQPTRSLVERFGNCCLNDRTKSQCDRWTAYLVRELYGVSLRPKGGK